MTRPRWIRWLGAGMLAVIFWAAPGTSMAQLAVLYWSRVGFPRAVDRVDCETETDIFDSFASVVAANPGVELALKIEVHGEVSPEAILELSRTYSTVARIIFMGDTAFVECIQALQSARRKGRQLVKKALPLTAPAPSGPSMEDESGPVILTEPALPTPCPCPCPCSIVLPQARWDVWEAGVRVYNYLMGRSGPSQARSPLWGDVLQQWDSRQMPLPWLPSGLQGPTQLWPDANIDLNAIQSFRSAFVRYKPKRRKSAFEPFKRP